MNKAELVSYVAKESSITKKAAEAVINSVIGAVEESLRKGMEIRISSLGSFRVIKRKARAGVNPQTKAKIKIQAMKAPAFRAAKALKDAVKDTPKKAEKKK